MSVTTQNIKWARLKLIKLNRDYKKAINTSRDDHGKWEAARKSGSAEKRELAFKAWQKSVKQAHDLGQQVNALSQYVTKGAQVASLDAAKAIASWEGGRSSDGMFHPYQDAVGVWTIGYGHTAGVNARTRPLTASEATTLLLHDLNTIYAPAVRAAFKRYKWLANQKMFDAAVSFVYNLGTGMLQPGHDISTAFAHRSVQQVVHAMMLYDKAGGETLPGLYDRRKWEGQLFNGGHYSR